MGLLTYDNGRVFIPNRELMGSYAAMMKKGNITGICLSSGQCVFTDAAGYSFAGDTDTMTQIIQYAHNTEVPILSYNNEVELSAIINLVYLAARDQYRVEREDKAGKGYVDFVFYPIRHDQDCIILELKVDHTPEEAIAQIKEKQYALRFKGKMSEAERYTGRILAVESVMTKKRKNIPVR